MISGEPEERFWGLKPRLESWDDVGLFLSELADVIGDLEELGFSCGVDFDMDGPLLVIRKEPADVEGLI